MAVRLDIAEHCVEIDDIGVTVRTILSVAAKGYEATGKRRWQLKYKGVIIGNFQVASPLTSPRKPASKPT